LEIQKEVKMKKCVECGCTKLSKSLVEHEYLKGSGLEVIVGGVVRWDCSQCGEFYVELKDTGVIDKALVRHIIGQPRRLGGRELKFLRRMMGWSAKDLSTYFQVPATTVSKWENDERSPGKPIDLFLRMLAAQHFGLAFTLETAPEIRQDKPEVYEPVHVTQRDAWVVAA
jgi:putative zinc finger/helix-turn-helix YgiT family protein